MLHDKTPLKRKCGQITNAGIPTNVDFFSNYYNSILVHHNMAIFPTKHASYLYCISKKLTYNVCDQKTVSVHQSFSIDPFSFHEITLENNVFIISTI